MAKIVVEHSPPHPTRICCANQRLFPLADACALPYLYFFSSRISPPVHVRAPQGKTPLHYAVMYEQRDLQVVGMLLERRAEVDAADDCGRTPLVRRGPNRNSLTVIRVKA